MSARALSLLLGVASAGACELTEVEIADVEDVVVAEVLVEVEDGPIRPDNPRVYAVLHRTSGAPSGVPGARVTIETPRRTVELIEDVDDHPDCTESAPLDYGRTCYRASGPDEISILPGDALRLTIDLPDGGRLIGETTVPGDFAFANGDGETCYLPTGTTFDLRWSRSISASAYVVQTVLQNFQEGLAELGIEVPTDYLYLLGLSASASDTEIAFPSELGLLERFSTERELLVALQQGLPRGAWARVSVTAVDRSYTNWARGGTFNPSGQVRLPSLRGDGTGFFGAVVTRSMRVIVLSNEALLGDDDYPPCG